MLDNQMLRTGFHEGNMEHRGNHTVSQLSIPEGKGFSHPSQTLSR